MNCGRLSVSLEENGYDILIADGLLDGIGDLAGRLRSDGSTVAVVTDDNVWREHGERLSASMSRADVVFEPIILSPGEENKSIQGLASLYDEFARLALTRGSLAVAFGGGVVGDLCGFAAATWMRGIRYIQVPTTLLAQIDSSVGGKTAVNIPRGKNLAGAFHQPSLVVIDPVTLETLPPREMRSGMAEAVKYGAIRGAPLFDLTASPLEPCLSDVIYECCRVKCEIVSADELDRGERMLLNFGHTFGHAIERESNFGKYRHGEAVAFGMTLAADIGERLGLTSPGVADALRRALASRGIQAEYPGSAEDLLPALAADKKSVGGGVRMVLLRNIGTAFIRSMSFSEISLALESAAVR
ncbi:MAG: 3-dehydroquinate synthase [Synergistaceae bacterium]|nr:3-dehydroquinate synthase [Synergistaceae bacterium]